MPNSLTLGLAQIAPIKLDRAGTLAKQNSRVLFARDSDAIIKRIAPYVQLCWKSMAGKEPPVP